MKAIIIRVAVAMLLFTTMPGRVEGHGGGLDRNGCHTNRKTGEYHCHGASTTPAPRPSPEVAPSPQRVSSAVTVRGAATTPEADLVRAAQVLLHDLGYRPSLLGTRDERTEAAVRAFQRAEKLTADGVISEYLVLRLAEAVANKCD